MPLSAEFHCPHCGQLVSDTQAEEGRGICPVCKRRLCEPASQSKDAEQPIAQVE